MSALAFTLAWLAAKALVTVRAALPSPARAGAPDPEAP